MGSDVFRDGSVYGSAFRSRLLPAALVSSPGHCLDLGWDAFLQAAAVRKHSWGQGVAGSNPAVPTVQSLISNAETVL